MNRANKGIGFEIVRKLCREHADKYDVVLTARNPELGKAAVSSLSNDGSIQSECEPDHPLLARSTKTMR